VHDEVCVFSRIELILSIITLRIIIIVLYRNILKSRFSF